MAPLSRRGFVTAVGGAAVAATVSPRIAEAASRSTGTTGTAGTAGTAGTTGVGAERHVAAWRAWNGEPRWRPGQTARMPQRASDAEPTTSPARRTGRADRATVPLGRASGGRDTGRDARSGAGCRAGASDCYR